MQQIFRVAVALKETEWKMKLGKVAENLGLTEKPKNCKL